MIEGLKITIKGKELREHLYERASYHKERAAHYKKLGVQGVESGEEEDSIVRSALDIGRQFRNKEAQHIDKESYLRFLGEHVVLEDEYLLDLDDLRAVEIRGAGGIW